MAGERSEIEKYDLKIKQGSIESFGVKLPPQAICSTLPARQRNETVIHKLKLLKQEIKHIIGKLTDWKDFVFSNRLLPFETFSESNAHCTHLQITQSNPQSVKECNSSYKLI